MSLKFVDGLDVLIEDGFVDVCAEEVTSVRWMVAVVALDEGDGLPVLGSQSALKVLGFCKVGRETIPTTNLGRCRDCENEEYCVD